MLISGLTVAMDAPNTAALDDYYNVFGANAAHLWSDGLPTKTDAWRAGGKRFLAWTLANGNAFNGDVIGGYGANVPGRIGYQVGDEPRSMTDLIEMEGGINAIRAVDPDALIFVNFSFQPDGIGDFLSYYNANMDGDIVSFDRYSRSNSNLESLALFRDAALAGGKPYWAYLRSFRGEGDSHSTATDMRSNVYSHVLFGYTGYSWFVYQIDAPTPNGDIAEPLLFATVNSFEATKTNAYADAAELNRELANVGRVITQLTSTDVRYLPFNALAQPDGTTDWTAGAGGDRYLTRIEAQGDLAEVMVGFFVDDCGDQYFMVQNPNHENGSFPVDNDDALTVELDFDFSSAPAATDTSSLSRFDNKTAAIESVELTETSATTASLSITLAAGDAAMFKYKTPNAFALQSL